MRVNSVTERPQPFKLYYRYYETGEGTGNPLVILHGLFGNQGNWAWHARELARRHDVYVMDLRNHGRSDWDAVHDYQSMAADVLQTIDDIGLERVDILGHSMGGKVAMALALQAPQRVDRLLVADIAPVTYPNTVYLPLQAMQAVPLDRITTRKEADECMAEQLESATVREFLLTNLQRDDQGTFRWRCNLEAIARNFDLVRGFPNFGDAQYAGPTLFIKGGESDYIDAAHKGVVTQLFPDASLKVIDNAGHWLHSEKPRAFLRVINGFLGDPLADEEE